MCYMLSQKRHSVLPVLSFRLSPLSAQRSQGSHAIGLVAVAMEVTVIVVVALVVLKVTDQLQAVVDGQEAW